MAKFALECPHCGTLNQASTFIFAKKTIECGHCKQAINVKENRLTSRQCPHCKNVFLFDQSKQRNDCPVCHKSIGARFGKLVSFPCPECGCIAEVSEGKKTERCAVCDCEIDVAKAVAKSKLVTDTGISVIKYEGDNDTFVWKHPIEDFNFGSQLIVHESQEAIFFLNGQALDTFGPGKHALETESMPILKKLQNLPTGHQNPFHAEVYFINKTVQMNLLWGVGDVNFKEPTYGLFIKIGASGALNLQVSDSRKLLVKLVGTTNRMAWESTDSIKESLRPLFNPLIRNTVKANLPSIIKSENIDVLELGEYSELIAERLREKISAGMEEYGFTIPQFHIENFALPDDRDENFSKLKKFTSAKLQEHDIEYEQSLRIAKQKAEIEAKTGALEFDRIEAEKKKIAAQAEADSRLIKGDAGIELKKRFDAAEAEKIAMQGIATGKAMEAQGYNKKDELAADVQKAWATGVGQMGSNGGGGGIISDVVAIGATAAAGGVLMEKMTGAMQGISGANTAPEAAPQAPFAPTAPAAANAWTCACGQSNTGKFCSNCGTAKPEAWDCACGAKGNTGKFCSNCGAAKPEAWDCACGAKGNTGKFCSNCGSPKASPAPATWTCGCGQTNITGKFCPECGAKKEDQQA